MELLKVTAFVSIGAVILSVLLALLVRHIGFKGSTKRAQAMNQKAPRSEQIIFDDLADLCSSPGYIHAIAYFSWRDNMIRYSEEMKPEDMQHMFSHERLIRTEISTLIGLLLKSDIDYSLPAPEVVETYLERTEALLEEMHRSMSAEFLAHLNPEKAQDPNFNPFTIGSVLREPIFYGGESAYSFQYRDLSVKKYARDNDWLTANRGFSVQEARNVVHAVGRMQDEKTLETIRAMRESDPEQWTILPGYTFTAAEVAAFSALEIEIVRKVLSAFSAPPDERNSQFNALHDYNIANALPLIFIEDETYILFHIYSLVEALYESPFYWMAADSAYVSTALGHRGLYTEEFSTECLVRVFGDSNVYANVEIFEAKKNAGEIDVLAVFGDRAIVLQAKSKRLTLEARRGNDQQIKDDFKKSVQNSCGQAYKCADMLRDAKYTLKDRNLDEIVLTIPIKEIYVLCVVSDHYPALSFQSRQFLKFDPSDGISPPFVLDVFMLDAMTEMLESPLQLLSYIDRRAKYYDQLLASHELTVLSYHLKQNLWLSGEHDLVMLGDDISTDLDLAMLARREGIPAKKTPDGILTRFASTTLGRILSEIESRPDPGTIDLGFLLLTLNEQTVTEISEGIDELARRSQSDSKSHDLTVGFEEGETGITLHCNDRPPGKAGSALERHCHMRKYTQHAQTWYGLWVSPSDKSLRFGLKLDYAWEPDPRMDSMVAEGLSEPGKLPDLLRNSTSGKRKVGRNELCPCGSGKKHKHCCLRRKS